MKFSDFYDKCILSWKCPRFDIKSVRQLNYQTKLKPVDYLRFATKDLELDVEHFPINALSNAKRAIDCQVDNLFAAFGFKKVRNFPSKLEFIEKNGLLAPRILKKVIKIRNMLEHEYYRPSVSEVEDAVDIAALFIEVSARPFRRFMDGYFVADASTVHNFTPDEIRKNIEDDGEVKIFTFSEAMFVEYDGEDRRFYIDCIHSNEIVREVSIENPHKHYMKFVEYTIKHDCDHDLWDEKGSANAFISMVGDIKNDI